MNTTEYLQRRNSLFSRLANNSITIIGSWQEQKLNEDVEYLYKQNPNLYYLTGWTESNTILILEKEETFTFTTLLVPPKDPSMEIWTGKRYGPEGAFNIFGVDNAHNISSFTSHMNALNINNYTTIYYDCPNKESQEYKYINKIISENNKYEERVNILLDLKPIIELERVRKTEYEINLIRKSCQLSAKAHILAMKSTYPGMNEYHIDGIINGYLMWNGSKRLAYPNVVASGNNATTLHYDTNNSIMQDNSLVLIDAGGELDYYASDITRTYPVNGKFTKEQAEIYQIVLDAQKACINNVKPGITVWDLHDLSCRIITEGLIRIGLLLGTLEENIKNESYKKFYMHSIGHWMGLDVHDCRSIDRKKIKLEPGYIFTIEPGIYISADLDVMDKYKGIGVRIEDDILVTNDGYEILSIDVPKEIYEIENIIGTKQFNLFE